jgi:hypothetical protein
MLTGVIGLAVPVWGQVKAMRRWLTLLVVASAAAVLYWKFATVERDRNQLRGFARIVCASAGEGFDASIEQLAGTKRVFHQRGELCGKRIARLAEFERDATRASNEGLSGALRDHQHKSAADLDAVARDAAAAADAARRMEKASAAIGKDDRVGRDWFDALTPRPGIVLPIVPRRQGPVHAANDNGGQEVPPTAPVHPRL